MSGIRSLYRGPTVKGYPSAASVPIYVDSDDNRVKVVTAGTGSTEVILQEALGASGVEKLITTRVLTLADSGKTFILALAAGFTVTLPAIAGSSGFNARFYVQIAPTGDYNVASAEGDNMAGQVYESSGGDGDSETAFTADQVTFVAAAGVGKIGDSMDIFSDGVGWYARVWVDTAGGATLNG
jgi:hypothetical protein